MSQTSAISARGERIRFDQLQTICQAVSAGETTRYTRATLAALTQKHSGSFDSYLSAFETQAAYVKPSVNEKLEIFIAGLNQGNRVVLRPDLTAYDSWDPLVTACKAYVAADLRSSALGAKVPLATVAGVRSESSAPKRQIHEPVPDSKRSKKAQNRRLNAAQQQPTVPQSAPPASQLAARLHRFWPPGPEEP